MLRDNSVVKINPYPIIEKLEDLDSDILLRIYRLCDPTFDPNKEILIEDSDSFAFLLGFYKHKLYVFNDNNQVFLSLSPDFRRIIINSVNLKKRCCSQKLYATFVNPLKTILSEDNNCIIQ